MMDNMTNIKMKISWTDSNKIRQQSLTTQNQQNKVQGYSNLIYIHVLVFMKEDTQMSY
jgi:hypothetical protein